MTPDQVAEDMRRLSTLLDKGLAELRKQALAVADAEADYRKAKAVAWMKTPDDVKQAAHREAWVNAAVADKRRDRDIAEGLKMAATEAVRTRRTQVSALQSLMNAYRAEAEFARTGGGT